MAAPNEDRFREVIGGLIAEMTRDGRRLRAFGEMVALLWARGDKIAAIRLEDFWNALAKKYDFALFCAYPIGGFAGSAESEPFTHICGQHSRVLPAESYGGLRGDQDRLRAVTLLQQKAASLEAEIERAPRLKTPCCKETASFPTFWRAASESLHKVGPDGTILWANQAELNLLGYARDEYIGHNIVEFHVDRPVIDDMLATLMRGENLFDCPARLLCKDGTFRHVLVHSNAYFEDGKFVYSRCFTRDVTAMKLAEQRQWQSLESERAARTEAERASRLKEDFLATLSHELRTPLNAIFGWTQIIKQALGDAESVTEGIAVIDRNVRAQTRLIEDLLDMSRIIAGKVRLDMQQIELKPVLQAAAEAVGPSAQAKEIQITQVLDPLAGPVSGDANRLQQVVWNLLANSVKFTPRGGKIDLILERVNSHVEITVSDNGQGIKPEFLPHVFERFRQADSSMARKHGGLGLGLSIVKHLVELHGGAVRAKSAGEGHGARFTVALPLVAVKQPDGTRQIPNPGGSCSWIAPTSA